MNNTRKHLPWFVAAGSALALTGTLVMVQPWQSADAVAYAAENTTVAVAEAPAADAAAPALEVVVEAPETAVAEVAVEAAPAAAPATSAPTATPTRTAAPASGAVSRDRAIQLAINAAGGGTVVDVSQGSERGIPTWEFLVRRTDGSQVEVYVARNNGNIVKVENANDW